MTSCHRRIFVASVGAGLIVAFVLSVAKLFILSMLFDFDFGVENGLSYHSSEEMENLTGSIFMSKTAVDISHNTTRLRSVEVNGTGRTRVTAVG